MAFGDMKNRIQEKQGRAGRGQDIAADVRRSIDRVPDWIAESRAQAEREIGIGNGRDQRGGNEQSEHSVHGGFFEVFEQNFAVGDGQIEKQQKQKRAHIPRREHLGGKQKRRDQQIFSSGGVKIFLKKQNGKRNPEYHQILKMAEACEVRHAKTENQSGNEGGIVVFCIIFCEKKGAESGKDKRQKYQKIVGRNQVSGEERKNKDQKGRSQCAFAIGQRARGGKENIGVENIERMGQKTVDIPANSPKSEDSVAADQSATGIFQQKMEKKIADDGIGQNRREMEPVFFQKINDFIFARINHYGYSTSLRVFFQEYQEIFCEDEPFLKLTISVKIDTISPNYNLFLRVQFRK